MTYHDKYDVSMPVPIPFYINLQVAFWRELSCPSTQVLFQERNISRQYITDCINISASVRLYLILLLVNMLSELGQIMTRYDFLWARQVILSNVRTDSQLDLVTLLVYFVFELGQIMTISYRPDEWFWAMCEPTSTWHNFTFGQFDVARKPIINGGDTRPLVLLFNYGFAVN